MLVKEYTGLQKSAGLAYYLFSTITLAYYLQDYQQSILIGVPKDLVDPTKDVLLPSELNLLLLL